MNFKIGDRVAIKTRVPAGLWDGRTGVVLALSDIDGEVLIRLDVSKQDWTFYSSWLELIETSDNKLLPLPG